MKKKLLILVSIFAILLTAAIVGVAQERCSEVGSILSVVRGKSGKYETVTFTVNSTEPDYEVRTARPPFQEYGSEDILRIRGPYYKSVFFKGVMWTCSILENFRTKTTNIGAPRNIEQFEGHVEYIVGYRRKGSYVGTTKTVSKGKTKIVVKFRK